MYADTFATFYVSDAAVCAAKNVAKYAKLCRNYIFVPLTCEVCDAWCNDGLEFLYDLGSSVSDATGDRRSRHASCFKECILQNVVYNNIIIDVVTALFFLRCNKQITI